MPLVDPLMGLIPSSHIGGSHRFRLEKSLRHPRRSPASQPPSTGLLQTRGRARGRRRRPFYPADPRCAARRRAPDLGVQRNSCASPSSASAASAASLPHHREHPGVENVVINDLTDAPPWRTFSVPVPAAGQGQGDEGRDQRPDARSPSRRTDRRCPRANKTTVVEATGCSRPARPAPAPRSRPQCSSPFRRRTRSTR